MLRWTCAMVVCMAVGAFAANSHETGIGSAPGAKTTTCPCGLSNKKGRIVGGTYALPNEYPWAAMLAVRNTLDALCGSSIITNTVAITAAHCTHTLPSYVKLNLIAGTSDVNFPGQMVPVNSWIEHEAYYQNPDDVSTMVNDIALVFLGIPLIFTPTVSPICMPTGAYNIDNQWVKLVGWGRLGAETTTIRQLVETDVKKVPFNQCQLSHPLKYPQTQFCVFWPGRGACMGDSGGPVTYLDQETNRYVLMGVVSFGSGDCNPNIPTVMTDVPAFLPWIRSKLNTLGCQKIG